jgi:hypothetical protein
MHICNKNFMRYLVILVSILFYSNLFGQVQKQVVRGVVLDAHSREPIELALISAKTAKTGAKSDSLGRFRLELPLGRHILSISRGGYEPKQVTDILVTSAKELDLSIELSRTVNDEVIVSGDETMQIREIGARSFTMEQTSRIAGGFDDPARFATAFAGVTSGVSNNAIIVRGNAPTAIQWRLNGVEIPNPNHFADLQSFGGGGLTALSTQVISSSKFLIGALPSPYQNGLAGAFDIQMREGNSQNFEHTFQLGGIGIDAASEGPIGLGDGSSYLFNYRYSTLTLLEPLLPEEAAGTSFQDLAFNVNVPMGADKILLWGFGLTDNSGTDVEKDPSLRIYPSDIEQQEIDQIAYATGLSHKTAFGSMSLNSTLAYTERRLDLSTNTLYRDVLQPTARIDTRQGDLSLTTQAVGEIATGVYFLSGIRLVRLGFDLGLSRADSGVALARVVDNTGTALLANAHAGIEMNCGDLKVETGLATQYLDISRKVSLEPRVSLTYKLTGDQSLGLAYGLHSRMERLSYYYIDLGGSLLNKDMDFSKAHHLVGQYKAQLAEGLSMELSPYYQSLFSVPIVRGTPISLINNANDWFFARELHNEGRGKNYGIDLTLEQSLMEGYFFLLSGSLLKSEYQTDDNLWRQTRYDRVGAINAVLGSEWSLDEANKNTLALSVRGTYQGGLREMTLLQEASKAANMVVLDTASAFNRQLPSQAILHFTASYRFNGAGHSWVIALGLLNITGAEEFTGYRKNLKTGEFEEQWDALVIPNLSIKLEF